jgi:hypothetical protein
MQSNFYFDAFVEPREPEEPYREPTKAERIANLKAGIEMYGRLMREATDDTARNRFAQAYLVRITNLSKLEMAA